MAVGLSTYAFQWRGSAENKHPMDLFAMMDETLAVGATVLQICDYPAIESMSDKELARLRSHADATGLSLELGTRGIDTAHLRRYLEMANQLGARFVRSMLHVPDHHPTAEEAVDLLADSALAYGKKGVTLGLETYEQVATDELVGIVEAVNSPFVGICLDPANSVARLEMPTLVIAMCAPMVVNVHVKDFEFTRASDLAGFSLTGCPLGTGLLPYDSIIEAIRPLDRNVNLIVEHWVPPGRSLPDRCDMERAWTRHSVDFIAGGL